MANIRQDFISENLQKQYGLIGVAFNPTCLAIHNTANDASAKNEINYMKTYKSSLVCYHFAVDDAEVVQGLPLTVHGWHAGDGNGKGNRESIGIEICYSKSGGDRFNKAEDNAADLAASLLKERGWGIDKVTKHKDYSGKYCPHRTLDMGWQRFLDKVSARLNVSTAPAPTPTPPAQPIATVNTLVVAKGTWWVHRGAGDGVHIGTVQGGSVLTYDKEQNGWYHITTAAMQGWIGRKAVASTSTTTQPTAAPTPTPPAQKSVDELARECIAGKWGNGTDRKSRLTAAGYNYSAVQKRVNELI